MKKLLIILTLAFLTSCTEGKKESENTGDNPVTSSKTYKKYLEAHNEYASCKMTSPQLTQDFMDKKITQEEFASALERNGKTCNIKKEIFNKYYQLLEAEFDKEVAEKHKITVE